jgi:hypothetical protein
MNMISVAEVLKRAEQLGLECPNRTFWRYYQLGFLPRGHKVPGRGNVLYFPDETALRLWVIHFLTQQLGLTFSEVARYPWSQFECQNTKPMCSISGEFVLTAKHQFDKIRDAALHKFVGELVNQLTETTERSTCSMQPLETMDRSTCSMQPLETMDRSTMRLPSSSEHASRRNPKGARKD